MSNNPLKALRDMANGVISEDTINFAKKNNKIVETVDPAEKAKMHQKTTKSHKKDHYSMNENDSYEDDEQDHSGGIDWEKEARKRLASNDIKVGPGINEVKEVPTDAIEALLGLGGGPKKKLNEIQQEFKPNPKPATAPQPTQTYQNPVEQYSKPKKQVLREEVETSINKDALKSLIYEVMFDELIIDGRLKKMVKECLKEVLQEIKAKK